MHTSLSGLRRQGNLRRALALLPAFALAGCPVRAPVPAAAATAPQPAPHLGRPYTLDSGQSLLVVLVYRAGALASAGHNHVIASHAVEGTVYVADDPLKSSFEVRIPVAGFTIDEEPLRAAQHSGEFPPGVPDSARQGTREHMLGPDQLDAVHSPLILLRAVRLAPVAGDAQSVSAQVQVTVRDSAHLIEVPVHYGYEGARLVLHGEAALTQTQLGLTPYSAMLGALQVQDELRVKFNLVAVPAR
ncbi:MAG: YceI family protein [Proteobacteria bacterium]|nr:YceI family protein [Pseudomonadota bacterium]